MFSSDRAGNEDIWSVALADGALTQITSEPTDEYAPAAEDETLYFVSERGGKVGLYRQHNNDPATRLATAPAGVMHQPRVSPDGRTIAWVQAGIRNGFPGVALNDLVLLDLQSGQTRIVDGGTADPGAAPDIFATAPAWLDNDSVAYTADGRIKVLTAGTGAVRDIPFAATLTLRRSPVELRTPLAMAPDIKAHAQPALGLVDPVVLQDDSIVFAALSDLWRAGSSGVNVQLQQLTNDAFVERDSNVSPDGKHLIYISDRGESMQIWRRDLTTGVSQRITANSNGPRYPTFSPDGQKIAWLEVGPIGTQDFTLRLLDIATGDARKLRSSPKVWPGRIAWSADGRHVTVAELHKQSGRATDGTNRLVRIDVEADAATVLALPGDLVPDCGPVASFDHRQLALIVDGGLWRVPVNTDGSIAGTPMQVLDALVESPAWSHDNERLTVLTARGLETVRIGDGARTVHDVPLTWRAAAGASKQLLHAGHIWDGLADGYKDGVDIFITGDRISGILPHAEHPAGLPVIDAGEQTVLPGLIDHHVHFEPHKGEWVGRALLAFGVTTVVEPGGLPYESREHMESWLSGRRLGPRLVFAGPQLDGARRTFYFASHINSEQRLRRELERGDRLGYGLLKTYRRMKPELQALTVQLGHERGWPVTSHAALRNLGFGGDRTEHLRGSGRTGNSSKQSDLLNSYADIQAIYSATQAAITPTLVNQGGFFDFALSYKNGVNNGSNKKRGDSPAADNRGLESIRQYTALYPAAYRENLASFTKIVARKIDLVRAGLGNAGSTLRQLDTDGVPIVAGTDSPIFPYGLALIIELQNYVDAGLKPVEALRAATSNAAGAMGAGNEIGRLAPGMRADLVITDGDPLTRITDLMQVRGVMLNGLYRSLDELLMPERGLAAADLKP